MENKYIIGLLALVVVLAGFGAYQLGSNDNQNEILGAAINYSNSLSNKALADALFGLHSDLVNIRAPLAGLLATSTATIDFPAVSSTTTQGTTTAAGIAIAAGDLVFVSPATITPGVSYYGSVNVASTTSATIQITAVNASSSTATVDPATTVFKVTVLPTATFAAPAAIVTTTSTAN